MRRGTHLHIPEGGGSYRSKLYYTDPFTAIMSHHAGRMGFASLDEPRTHPGSGRYTVPRVHFSGSSSSMRAEDTPGCSSGVGCLFPELLGYKASGSLPWPFLYQIPPCPFPSHSILPPSHGLRHVHITRAKIQSQSSPAS